jgi:hypothetical protein
MLISPDLVQTPSPTQIVSIKTRADQNDAETQYEYADLNSGLVMNPNTDEAVYYYKLESD